MGDGSEGASANDVGAPFKTVKTDSRTVTAFGAPLGSIIICTTRDTCIYRGLEKDPLSNNEKERHSTQTGLKSK